MQLRRHSDELEGSAGMSMLTSTETLWVVVDAHEQVVLICSGTDGAAAAAEWVERGYTVRTVAGHEVGAA
jgi:hypothetical protein